MAKSVGGWNGIQQLEKTLEALPDRLGKKVLNGALRAAGQVIRKEAKRNAPELKQPHPYRKPGTLKRSIVVRKSKRDKFGVYIGVRSLKGKSIVAFKKTTGLGSNKNPDDPYYWWFVEFGTKHIAAQPFLRPAFETKHRHALTRFNQYTLQRLEKEAEKLARIKGLPK